MAFVGDKPTKAACINHKEHVDNAGQLRAENQLRVCSEQLSFAFYKQATDSLKTKLELSNFPRKYSRKERDGFDQSGLCGSPEPFCGKHPSPPTCT